MCFIEAAVNIVPGGWQARLCCRNSHQQDAGVGYSTAAHCWPIKISGGRKVWRGGGDLLSGPQHYILGNFSNVPFHPLLLLLLLLLLNNSPRRERERGGGIEQEQMGGGGDVIHGSWQGLSVLSYFIAFAGERDTAQHERARQRVEGSHRVFCCDGQTPQVALINPDYLPKPHP